MEIPFVAKIARKTLHNSIFIFKQLLDFLKHTQQSHMMWKLTGNANNVIFPFFNFISFFLIFIIIFSFCFNKLMICCFFDICGSLFVQSRVEIWRKSHIPQANISYRSSVCVCMTIVLLHSVALSVVSSLYNVQKKWWVRICRQRQLMECDCIFLFVPHRYRNVKWFYYTLSKWVFKRNI